jgi:hypothetical protein
VIAIRSNASSRPGRIGGREVGADAVIRGHWQIKFTGRLSLSGRLAKIHMKHGVRWMLAGRAADAFM